MSNDNEVGRRHNNGAVNGFDASEMTNSLINGWLEKTRGLPITLQLTKLGFAVIEALEEAFALGQGKLAASTDASVSEVKVVHNCWAIYKSQPLKTGELWTEAHRPQDWGDPKWVYRRYAFECSIDERLYRSVVHCWIDEAMSGNDAKTLFRDLIITIMIPGRDEKECGNTHIAEDDIWVKAWGKLPPRFERQEEDFDY